MGRGSLFSRNLQISLKRGKIGPSLLSMTNRKSLTRFRLVPKSRPWMTLKGHYALFFKTRDVRLSEPTTKIWMKIQHCQRRWCSAMTLFWQYKVYADIRSGSQDLCKFSWFYAYARILRIHVPHVFSLSSSIVFSTTVIYQWLQRRVVKCGLAEMWQAD